jgi:hypothetical protein
MGAVSHRLGPVCRWTTGPFTYQLELFVPQLDSPQLELF